MFLFLLLLLFDSCFLLPAVLYVMRLYFVHTNVSVSTETKSQFSGRSQVTLAELKVLVQLLQQNVVHWSKKRARKDESNLWKHAGIHIWCVWIMCVMCWQVRFFVSMYNTFIYIGVCQDEHVDALPAYTSCTSLALKMTHRELTLQHSSCSFPKQPHICTANFFTLIWGIWSLHINLSWPLGVAITMWPTVNILWRDC